MPGIFLSHAHADRALADLIRNALILAGVSERRIFYSSSRATGIPSGEDVRSYLQRSLRDAGLVIELVSATFLTRPMCLMELGGAWSLGTPTYPIVVPPLSRETVARQIGDVQMGVLGAEEDLDELFDELHDRLASDVSIVTETTSWNRAIRSFKLQLASTLAATQPAPQQGGERLAVASRPTKVPGSARDIVASAEGVTVSNVTLGPRGDELFGEVTNGDGVGHTVYLDAIFYGANGGIVGSKLTIVPQLAPGDTKTFHMDRVPAHDRHKVEIRMLGGP
jgi:hypothetical protein